MATPVNGSSVLQRALLGGCAAILFLLLTVLFVWLQGDSGSTAKDKKFTHLHCPECLLEMTYLAAKEGQPCPQCGGSGPKLVATVGPYKDRHRGQASIVGKTLVAALVALVLVLAFLYGWVYYLNARRRAEEDARNQPSLVCHCPFCTRKIGYPARKIGAGVVCPRCKTAFTLPQGVAIEP